MTDEDNTPNQPPSAALDELIDLLKIPSISALPEHAPDVQRAARWVADRMIRAGIEQVEVMPTGGHPVVYGEWLHAPGGPTALVYGHFDVQPVDPIALWTHPPFEPAIVDGRIYARGASDSKSNVLGVLWAVDGLLRQDGGLPINLKFIFEGQEEIGSPQLPTFVAEHSKLLACDFVLNSDGGMYSEDQPAIPIGLKGLAGVQIDVRGAATDLHSGVYGGVAPNPIHALIRLLDSMRSTRGSIAIQGFYDAVVPLTSEDRDRFAAVPFDEEEYRRQLGVDSLWGEPEFTPIERLWARPTLEINGIWGGFQGEGIKTVIPNEAHAKVTCRLVPDQDPASVVQLITAHVKRHTPAGVTATVSRLPGSARPYLVSPDHPVNVAVAAVLTELYGKEPYYVRTGGTVPVCETFLTHLHAATISMGFGLPDQQIHAPNEFQRFSCFGRGIQAWTRLLERLGDTP